MLNQIVLMGRLTKDPEVRKVGEKQVSKGRFTLAVKDGVPHYGFEVSANEVGFADAPQKQGGQAKGNANTTPNTTDGVPAGDIFGDANGFPDDFTGFGGDFDGNEDDLPF